jgi:tRNA (adenine37-N6)-methyltransferase
MNTFDPRPGEIHLPFDPATTADDVRITFIGRIRTAWKTRSDCPKNVARARERNEPATLELDPEWRPGLTGLDAGSHAIVLYWMHEARRDLIVQRPRHRTTPTGVFALRSPVRPNPIALATVRLLAVDVPAGRVTIDAIDCVDGTPLIDIKPWIESIDLPVD